MTCNLKKPYDIEHTTKIPTFSRNRKNLIFEKGDEIEIFAFPKIRPLKAEWTLCHNMVNKPFWAGKCDVEMDQSVKMTIPPDKLQPGFYDIYFTVYATDKIKESGKTTFGYRVNDLKITDSMPEDFEKFWDEAKKKLEKISLNPKVTFVKEMSDKEISEYNIKNASIPEKCDPEGCKYKKVKLYKVEFDSLAQDGKKRYYGWFAVPTAKGKYPGMLVLPGAGCAALPAPLEHARHGYAALMLHIHGMQPDLKKYKTPAKYLKGSYGNNVEDDYYYYVYLACVQAVKFLENQDIVDKEKLVICGGSQGGLLTMVTTALCPQVKAAVASICYHGYWPFRDEVTRLNKIKSDGTKNLKIPFERQDKRQNHMSYYDAMNFAKIIKVPVLMSCCLCDMPSPATSVWAIFDSLKINKKEIMWSPGTDHDIMIPFEKAGFKWLH